MQTAIDDRLRKLPAPVRSTVEAALVGIGAFRDHASLFFPHGRELDDGTGILLGSGRQFRFITLRTPVDVDRAEVKRMVQEAFRFASQSLKAR